jgi:starch phosphorylase
VFARRVAVYKRLYLFLHHRDRLARLLEGSPHVQLLLAGKAHPQDDEAKWALRGLLSELRLPPVAAARMLYLEDYDMEMASRLVAGCDVWVNLPRPPLEASGTSGMKAALNGALNVSIPDGWWEEAHDGSNGWAVLGEDGKDHAEQDANDATAFMDLLEREVVPLFIDRDETGIPRGWMKRMRSSLRSVGSRFVAGRMMAEYVEGFYGPAASSGPD